MKKGLFLSLLIVLLTSPSLFAGEDDIVVVSRTIHGDRMTLKTLQRIYLKRKTFWKDGKRIVPVNLPPGNELRIFFSRRVLKKTHRELVEYWNEQHFNGVNPPVVLESEEAVKRFVREVDGAIGYIRRSNLDPDLKVLLSIGREK